MEIEEDMNKLSINSMWSETVFVFNLHNHLQPDLSGLVKKSMNLPHLEALK